MEEFNDYRFRALTKNGGILILVLIIPIFFTIYILMDKFIFYDIKTYGLYTNIRVIGIPMILTYFLLVITSNYILGKKYLIKIKDNEIIIYRSNKIFHVVKLSQIDKVVFNFSSKQRNGFLSFNCNNIKISMLVGLLFTRKIDFIRVNNYFNTTLYPYLLNNNFSESIEEKKGMITHTLTKKD